MVERTVVVRETGVRFSPFAYKLGESNDKSLIMQNFFEVKQTENLKFSEFPFAYKKEEK